MTKLRTTKKLKRSPTYDGRFEKYQTDMILFVCDVCKYGNWYYIHGLKTGNMPNCPTCYILEQFQTAVYTVVYASNEVFLK